MSKPIYIAAYNQSKFGKLMAMNVPQIVRNAIEAVCRQISVTPAAVDVGSIGAACNFTLNKQGLLSGLMAMVPGMESKPMEMVENACASGGQAILSVIQKLQLGWGDTGVAVGYEKMRDNEGKMDGKLIGEVLVYFSFPDEREGKTFVFPHLFAEVMQSYMKEYGVTEEDLAQIAVNEYANAKYNPCAQMNRVQITLEQAMKIEGINRYVVEGLPLKTYDCSQITDGYAALILATEEGLKKLGVPKSESVEIAGFAQASDPLKKEGRDVLQRTVGCHLCLRGTTRIEEMMDIGIAADNGRFEVKVQLTAAASRCEGQAREDWLEQCCETRKDQSGRAKVHQIRRAPQGC